MSLEIFRRLESLSGTPFLILLIINCILFFIACFSIIYLEKKTKIISSVLFLVFRLVFIGFNIYLKPYYNIISSTNIDMREFQSIFGFKKYYTAEMRNLYDKTYLENEYSKNLLYENIENHIPIKYLGRDNDRYIFQIDDKYIYTFLDLSFSDTDNSNLFTKQFILKDKNFTEEGFSLNSKIFFDRYEIPKDLKDKIFIQDIAEKDLIHDISLKSDILGTPIIFP